SALLRQHRLALYEMADTVHPQNVEHGRVVFVRVTRPVYADSARERVAFELDEVLVQVGKRMAFDGGGARAQRFPLGYRAGSPVTLFADVPERRVMPGRPLPIRRKLRCRRRMVNGCGC